MEIKIRICDEHNRTIEIKKVSTPYEVEKIAILNPYWEYMS